MSKVAAVRKAAWLCAGSLLVISPAPASAAGLLEFLFGGFSDPRPQQRFEYSPPPLEMRVNPRRHRERSARPASDSKMARQTPIDPIKNPNWYLDDPTIRRGDIVVLKGRVLVYEGGSHHATEDFTILDRSRLVSAKEKERISRMARKGPFDDSPAVTAATAPPAVTAGAVSSAQTAPREVALRPTN